MNERHPDDQFHPVAPDAHSVSQVDGNHEPDSQDGDGWDDEGNAGSSPHPEFL